MRSVDRPLRGVLPAVLLSASVVLLATGAPTFAAPVKKPLDPVARMPALPPALFDDELDIGGKDINARKSSTRMTVEVKVNGKGPYRFVVDSGADTSVVGNRLARAQQLELGTPVFLNGVTDSSRVFRVLVDELQLGDSVIRNLELPALHERDLGADGMIGIDALVEQRLMLDFEKRTIKVEDAHIAAPKMDGEIVVTARRRRGQLILTQVSANRKSIQAVVDTGSEITIGNLALRDKLLRRSPSKLVTVGVTGVTGVTVDMQIARIADLRLGSITLHDVPIAFADVPPFEVFGLNKEPAMLLVTDILENFRRVSLDFRARRVRFQLKKCTSTGVVLSTSYTSAMTRVSSDNKDVCR